jgi:DNA-directed RNA polymerase subunit B"
MLDRTAVSRSYITRDMIVRHHIDSFNTFLDTGLQNIVDEQGIIETDINDEDEDGKYSIYVKLGEIRVGKPTIEEADGAYRVLFPSEARIRNITYMAPIYLKMTIIKKCEEDEIEEGDEQEVEIGEFPIMLKSKACNLIDLSETELVEVGEDSFDLGGYFIINGTERVIVTLEDLTPNKIFVEYEERYGDKIEVAKVFSQRMGYRALTTVERNRKSVLEVTFPSSYGKLNFVVLEKALGLETDEDIVKIVSDDSEIINFVVENLEVVRGIETKEEAIEAIGKKVAAGQTKEYQIRRANYIMDRYLLHHLGNDKEDRIKKAVFLGRMGEACCKLATGKRKEDDKDHYANKRLKLDGDLMEDIFRVSFSRLVRDIKYQLERSHLRGREKNIATAVRSDILTDRLLHPIATGNWVGGRTGVSQLLDRMDCVSMISHLRRVISPLSRSQPHFEARDLHPTQWGRICPNETPEGPNCGLVKNLAQMVTLSTGIDDEERDHTRSILRDLGVKSIIGGINEDFS